MSVYYAHKAGNINADDVWYDAASGGNLVSGATALAGTHTLRGNGFAVAINVDFTAAQIDTLTAVGNFTIAAAHTITANIVAGAGACLVPSGTGYTVTIVGNVSNEATLNYVDCIHNVVPVSLIINGNVTGGHAAETYGIYNASTGTVTVNGTVTAGSATNAFGVSSPSGSVTVSSGNIINNTITSAILGACFYHPGAGNYIEYPKTTGGAGVYKYGKTIPAASVIESVNGDGASAPAAGTYHEATVSEVQNGVAFGPSSTYTGTYTGGGFPLVGEGGPVG